MFTGQIHLFAYSEADYAAKASLLKALDPTSTVYEPGRFLTELNIHPAFSQHRQVHHAVVQSGRALCRT